MSLTPRQRAAAYAELRRRRLAALVASGRCEPLTIYSPLWVQWFDRWRMP